MAGKGVRLFICLTLLPMLAIFGSGFALPAPDPPFPYPTSIPDVPIKDITMAEFIAMEADRPFDYSFSFRYVKRGDIAYYVRFSSLYLCEGLSVTKLLDNAYIDWMFIGVDGDLWFCVGGSVDIAGGEMVERKALYRYDRAGRRFSLVKRESDGCAFCNRFYHGCFLYWEQGCLKAYDTAGSGTYLLGNTAAPAAYVSPDGQALYYTDAKERMMRLTGLEKQERKRTALNPEDFPLNAFTFDESIIVSSRNPLSYYRFTGTGYAKVCEFAPPRQFGSEAIFYLAAGGIGVIGDGAHASVDYYSFSAKSWIRIGNEEHADSCGYGEGACWFYTNTGPVRLYVFRNGMEYEYSFGSRVDVCSSIRIAGDKAYLFQYDGDWLTHVLFLDRYELCRISD